MNKEPLVSILCLTYNHAGFISQAIEGFLMQKTNFPFEILIHDDASTDGTTEIIKEYERKYPELIKPIYQKENQFSIGVKITLTYQYPRARGKYLAFCEGDDYWIDPNKLQKQVDFLEVNSDISLCYHGVNQEFIGGQTEVNSLSVVEAGDIFDTSSIWTNWTIQTSTIVIKSEIVRSQDFILRASDSKMYFGDMFLILSANEYGRVVGLKEIMSVYRKHSGSITDQGSNPTVDNMVKMLNYIRFIGTLFNGKYKSQCRSYYSFKTFRYAYVCKERGLINKSIVFFMKSFFSNPFKFYTLLVGEVKAKIHKKH